jgi:hypothetical protein
MGDDGQACYWPVVYLGVDIESYRDWRRCRCDGDVPTVHDDLRRVAFEVGFGRFDGNGAAFSGDERDVVVAVVNRQDAVSDIRQRVRISRTGRLPVAQLQMSHERDARTGIVQGD